VLAADLVGPFIYKGFSSLKVISPTTNRPFSGDREGLQLGEAVTMILLSRNKKSDADMRILSVASDTEGSSITRPSVNGLGLVRAMDKIQSEIEINPDLVVAHGTGTKFNDLAEELALRQYLGRLKKPQTPITNTKWCIGHTLGASGSVDLIAAAEILRNQRVFKIQNTSQRDPEFEMNYLTADSAPEKINNVQQILISSLGFGGIHAALMVLREKGSSEN
jgi:3-oxoacyl-(acyl-carrier-protein) synthase